MNEVLLYDELVKKTKELWLLKPPEDFLRLISSEVTGYKRDLAEAKRQGLSKKAEEIDRTIGMVLAQVDARLLELKAYVKKGMLDTVKQIIFTVIREFIKSILPVSLPPAMDTVTSGMIGEYVGIKIETKPQSAKEIMMSVELQEFKDYVKKEIHELEEEEIRPLSLLATLLEICDRGVKIFAKALNMNDVEQRDFLLVAVEELLEEVNLPYVEGSTEEEIKKKLVRYLPLVLDYFI
jgi:hypothetical protein